MIVIIYFLFAMLGFVLTKTAYTGHKCKKNRSTGDFGSFLEGHRFWVKSSIVFTVLLVLAIEIAIRLTYLPSTRFIRPLFIIHAISDIAFVIGMMMAYIYNGLEYPERHGRLVRIALLGGLFSAMTGLALLNGY